MTEYLVTRWYRAPELLPCCDCYITSIDVWSVGCVFAELLGRKPIFPGKECLTQLRLILNIENPNAKNYIKSLSYSAGTPFSSLFSTAHPLVIDLLQKMLVLDPSKRTTVSEALHHPYMSPTYSPASVPSATVRIDLGIVEDLDLEMIRELTWQEILHFHPEAATAMTEL